MLRAADSMPQRDAGDQAVAQEGVQVVADGHRGKTQFVRQVADGGAAPAPDDVENGLACLPHRDPALLPVSATRILQRAHKVNKIHFYLLY